MTLKFGKFFFFVMLFYSSFIQNVLSISIPNSVMLMGLMMVLCVAGDMLTRRQSIMIIFKPEIILWLIFALAALISGVFVAVNKSLMFSSVVRWVETLAMMVCAIYFCKMDDSIEFLVKAYVFVAIVSAVTTIILGRTVGSEGRLTLSSTANPNDVALQCFFGFVLLTARIRNAHKSINAVIIAACILLIYAIVQTGSRKCFLAAAIYIVLWIAVVMPEYNIQVAPIRRGFNVMAAILVVGVVVYLLLPSFVDTVLFSRLEKLFLHTSDNIRLDMYKKALIYFQQSPLFGIGFDNFRAYYGWYSHSTYAEALSCTGIVGCCLYFPAYFMIAYKLLKILRQSGEAAETRIEARVLLCFFAVLLFLGTGIILFYSLIDGIRFGLIFGFIYLHYKPDKEVKKVGKAVNGSRYIKS